MGDNIDLVEIAKSLNVGEQLQFTSPVEILLDKDDKNKHYLLESKIEAKVISILKINENKYSLLWNNANNVQFITSYTMEDIESRILYVVDLEPKENNNKEKPCKQCQRNNFVSDKKCWWCECSL